MNLLTALLRLAQRQRQPVDRLALEAAVAAASESVKTTPQKQLASVTAQLHLPAVRWHKTPDPAHLPVLLFDETTGSWHLLIAKNGKGEWVTEQWDDTEKRWQEHAYGQDTLPARRFAQLSLRPPYHMRDSAVLGIIIDQLLAQRWLLIEAALGGALIAVLTLMTALYTMQVYDRVIPTAAWQTLLVLTLGVGMAIFFEYLVKRLRSGLYERLIDAMDRQLARAIYQRFLAIRVDQLPQSVGSLASQLRGYETVRGFLVQLSTHFLVDTPFSLLFAGVMAAIAGPIAMIPVFFLLLSIATGLFYKGRILRLTERNQTVANLKTGLLVESVEGAEVIKSGQGGWRMLSRWLSSSDEARSIELETRRLGEHALFLAAAFQQIAYIGVVALGAVMVARGELSFGGLIACSILSGRVLSPIGQFSSQLVQYGHAKAALRGLDAIWKLEDDHHGVETPLMPERIRGHYQSESAKFSMQGRQILDLANLTLRPGEKVAVIGPVGAGKTTLLRLLSGLYRPQSGRILLDGMDLAYIAKPVLAEQMGYLPQDGRLFSGTLRENLILGMPDPGDSAILEAATQTGLAQSVITPHPMGLEQPIFEGGSGLSAGQRQLVNLTRLFLRRPKLWLLDEPTSNLDRESELRIIAALKATLRPEDGLILVTHKGEMLSLVDRVLVVVAGRIYMDGPRDAVLAQLQMPPQKRAEGQGLRNQPQALNPPSSVLGPDTR